MLRAGPLSSPEVLETLARDHVNAWALATDLAQLARAEQDPELRARLVKLDQAYTYPVESFVLSPQGEILARLAANDMSSDQDYVDFLELAATAR